MRGFVKQNFLLFDSSAQIFGAGGAFGRGENLRAGFGERKSAEDKRYCRRGKKRACYQHKRARRALTLAALETLCRAYDVACSPH